MPSMTNVKYLGVFVLLVAAGCGSDSGVPTADVSRMEAMQAAQSQGKKSADASEIPPEYNVPEPQSCPFLCHPAGRALPISGCEWLDGSRQIPSRLIDQFGRLLPVMKFFV